MKEVFKMEKLKCGICHYSQEVSQCEEKFTSEASVCSSFLQKSEMSMGDLADEQVWREQAWLENAKEDDEHNEWDTLDLVRCELCNKLFYFDGFAPKWCEDCQE